MSHNESAGCVDRMITENLKTPDRSPFCRASAQDGDSGTRELDSLSTNLIPKSTKHQTDRPSVGHHPRTVSLLPESPTGCRLNRYRKTQNTRQFSLLSGARPGRYPQHPRVRQSICSTDTQPPKNTTIHLIWIAVFYVLY